MINIKKIIKSLVLLFIVLLFVGCGKKSNKEIYEQTVNKIEKLNSYYISGVLEMINNENTYKYDVEVNYLKDDYFKVKLTNKSNNHEQIILRNKDGVYVVTPTLNKSFKFQSEWPYNNSQSYLLQTIIKDLENDDERIYQNNNDTYIFTGKVNYMNNTSLKKQKVYFNKKNIIKKVEVYDNDNTKKIIMSFNKVKYNVKINKEIFNLENNIKVNENKDEQKKVSNIEDIVYPIFLPKDTKLSKQETIKTSSGERLIQNFTGKNSFTLIQETLNDENYKNVFCEGDPLVLNDVIGYSDEYSVTWYDDKYLYYLVSNNLSPNDMLEIALSVNTPSVIK